MSEKTIIAVDAVGGDEGADVVLPGVEAALAQDADVEVLLCGPAEVVEPFAAAHDRCTAVPCTEQIDMAEHPVKAVRRKKDSSIVVGCKLIHDDRADGFFSAGSTGACLAAGTLVAGRLKGVSRPAMASIVPSPVKPIVMCDVGANADCKPEYLVQFAQMASVYVEQLLNRQNPTVALLNIGEEDEKGSAFAQQCNALLRQKVPTFAGNAEGRDVALGVYDVIVTDGFTGNVCLKTIEGTSKAIFGALKGIFKKNVATTLAAGVLKGGLVELKDSISADTYGGAPLLGTKGAILVGHGSSNATAVKNGILTCAKTSRLHVSDLIAQSVAEQSEQG